jgi:hypothetical protein
MKKLLILAIAILGIVNHGFAFEAGSIEAATPISSVPYTINSPGIYYLANNIFSHANAKITISASNVVLDLGGHTLQVSSTDECVLVSGPTFTGPETVWTGAGRGSFNVTIQNGALVNNVAGCILIEGAHGCVIDHVSAISGGMCTLFDISGANNRISNCTFASGSSLQGPNGPHGPASFTVFLLGCGDLVENNVVTSVKSFAIGSTNTGAAGTTLGNVLRNNVVWSPSASISSVGIDQFDVSTGNLFPGNATN